MREMSLERRYVAILPRTMRRGMAAVPQKADALAGNQLVRVVPIADIAGCPASY